jgi:hypothetical protein
MSFTGFTQGLMKLMKTNNLFAYTEAIQVSQLDSPQTGLFDPHIIIKFPQLRWISLTWNTKWVYLSRF